MTTIPPAVRPFDVADVRLRRVAPGFQQPEHRLDAHLSTIDDLHNRKGRRAASGGHFGYALRVDPAAPAALVATYPIATELTRGRRSVSVRFVPHEQSVAGPLYGLRVVRGGDDAELTEGSLP